MNVLGILTGSIAGDRISYYGSEYLTVSSLALVVIFAVLILLPILNVQLFRQLQNHPFLIKFTEAPEDKPGKAFLDFKENYHLTAKEMKVIKLLLCGYTYKGIAKKLYISENTLKYHVKNIYQKLNINSKMELVKMFPSNRC